MFWKEKKKDLLILILILLFCMPVSCTCAVIKRMFFLPIPPTSQTGLRFYTRGKFISARGVASFSTSCRLGWLSFSRILKIARMTSTHWPHQHFELLSFYLIPTTYNLLQAVEWSNQKFVAPSYRSLGWLHPCQQITGKTLKNSLSVVVYT